MLICQPCFLRNMTWNSRQYPLTIHVACNHKYYHRFEYSSECKGQEAKCSVHGISLLRVQTSCKYGNTKIFSLSSQGQQKDPVTYAYQICALHQAFAHNLMYIATHTNLHIKTNLNTINNFKILPQQCSLGYGIHDLGSLSGRAKTCLIPVVLKQFLGATQPLIGRVIETISGI